MTDKPETTPEEPATEIPEGGTTPEETVVTDVQPQGDRGNAAAQVWISAFLVVVLGFMAYIGCWNIPLHGEDQSLLQDNTALHRVLTTPNALRDLPGAPLAAFSLALNWQLMLGSLSGLHAMNLLLHLLNGVLLFLLCRRLFRGAIPEPAAMLSALLFVLNPLAAPCVDVLAARPYLQATFFSLLAVLLFLRAAAPGPARFGTLWLSYACFAAAAGSHIAALALPLAILAFDLLITRGHGHARLHAAFFVLALFLAAIYRASGALNAEAVDSRMLYALQAGLWLLAPLPFCFLRVAGLRAGLGVIVAAVLLFMGVRTYSANLAWQEPERFYAAQLEAAPADAEAAYFLGRYFLRQAELESEAQPQQELLAKAEASLRKASGFGVNLTECWRAQGTAAMRLGQLDAATADWKEVLRRDPTDAAAAEQLARCCEARMQRGGDPEPLRQALDYFRFAERSGKMTPEGALHYGTVLAGLGDAEGALARIKPLAGEDAKSPLAPLLKQLEAGIAQMQSLAKQSAEQVKANPASTDILVTRAEIQLMQGQALQSAYILDAMLRRQPDDMRAWTLLGYARARMGGAAGFAAEWRQARAATAAAWLELEKRCAATGLWDAAKTYAAASPEVQEGLALPETRIADIAAALKQPKLAEQLLEEAAQARPEDPAPWLKRCDLSIAAKDAQGASQALAEAEKRGAFPEEIESRRQQGGVAPAAPIGPVRNIIR